MENGRHEDSTDKKHNNNVLIFYMMGEIAHVLQQNRNFIMATDISISMFLRIGKHYPFTQSWFRKHKDTLRWMETWLGVRKQGTQFGKGYSQFKPRKQLPQTQLQNVAQSLSNHNVVDMAAKSLKILKAFYADTYKDVPSDLQYDSDTDPVSLLRYLYIYIWYIWMYICEMYACVNRS